MIRFARWLLLRTEITLYPSPTLNRHSACGARHPGGKLPSPRRKIDLRVSRDEPVSISTQAPELQPRPPSSVKLLQCPAQRVKAIYVLVVSEN